MSKLQYAAIYADENTISTQFCDTEEEAWKELELNSGETRDALESTYYVQGFTKAQIDAIPEVD